MPTQPPSARQSMIYTLIMGAMMLYGLSLAVFAPVDTFVRVVVLVTSAFFVFVTIFLLVLEKRHPEHAWWIFRAYVGPSGCMVVMSAMLAWVARHPHDLLPLLR